MNIFMTNEINKVNVLWTGGYDSSFRMVQLLKKDVTVQPYYLSDNRKSEQNELNDIVEITDDINKNEGTRCEILPLKIYNVSDVKEDEKITEAYSNLRKYLPLGSQYDWLPRFAKEHNIKGLELGLEKAETSVAYNCIQKYGDVKFIDHDEVAYYIINQEKSTADLIKIFGSFHFPDPLFTITKQEMLKEYKKLGFETTVSKTWFCFNPINNKPCGLCNPCKSTIEEGMEFRFPKSSLRRYKLRFFYKSLSRLKNGLARRLKNNNS